MNIDASADHNSIDVETMLFNRFGILKNVNILKDFTNPSLQNTNYFIYSLFQVIKYIRLY